jgi:hypothetical protein
MPFSRQLLFHHKTEYLLGWAGKEQVTWCINTVTSSLQPECC